MLRNSSRRGPADTRGGLVPKWGRAGDESCRAAVRYANESLYLRLADGQDLVPLFWGAALEVPREGGWKNSP